MGKEWQQIWLQAAGSTGAVLLPTFWSFFFISLELKPLLYGDYYRNSPELGIGFS